MNGEIVRYLSLSGPSLIYQIAKSLASQSQTKVHYPTVNRRVHDLVHRDYLAEAGTRKTKAGIAASLFATTIRGDLGSLATGLDNRDQFKLIQSAGQKQNSPFALLKLMVDRGMDFEFVQREFLSGIAEDLRNGYINIEALNEQVICAAFAASMARRLRIVMGEENGKEYVENVFELLTSLVSPSPAKSAPRAAAQTLAAISEVSAGAFAGAGAHIARDVFTAPPVFSPPPTRRPQDWRDELKQTVAEMLRE